MKIFELFEKQPLRNDNTLRASIKLCESIVAVLEASYEGGIDFEPQPDFKNVKGVNFTDRDQNIAHQSNVKKNENTTLNKAWVKLLSKMKNLDSAGRKKLRPELQKVANAASQRQFKLTPSVEQVFNL